MALQVTINDTGEKYLLQQLLLKRTNWGLTLLDLPPNAFPKGGAPVVFHRNVGNEGRLCGCGTREAHPVGLPRVAVPFI